MRQATGFIDRQAIKDVGKQLTTDTERHVTDAMNNLVGPESSLMQTLDPKHADGLVTQLQEAVEEELAANSGKVLGAFSASREPMTEPRHGRTPAGWGIAATGSTMDDHMGWADSGNHGAPTPPEN